MVNAASCEVLLRRISNKCFAPLFLSVSKKFAAVLLVKPIVYICIRFVSDMERYLALIYFLFLFPEVFFGLQAAITTYVHDLYPLCRNT